MMTSKTRSSLRRKHRTLEQTEENSNVDSEFEQLKSPPTPPSNTSSISIRKNRRNTTDDTIIQFIDRSRTDTEQPNSNESDLCLTRSFRSPIVTPTSKKGKSLRRRARDISFDESSEKLSQEPTPSKWKNLLPDYCSSQTDGAVCEVLWDCASPDAVKHLRRRRRDDKSIKEFVKHFKDDCPSDEGPITSPKHHLNLFRAFLQKQLQQQQNPPDNNSRKQKKLVEKRKQLQQAKEQSRQLFGQILSAVERRQELEAEQEDSNQRQVRMAISETTDFTFTSETANKVFEVEGDDDDNEDCWEDDELFQDNSFIISASQNPCQFLNTSRNFITTTQCQEQNDITLQEICNIQHGEQCGDNTSMLDSQNSGVVPPTHKPVMPRLIVQTKESRSSEKCRNLATRTGQIYITSSDRTSNSSKNGSPKSRLQCKRQASITDSSKLLGHSLEPVQTLMQSKSEATRCAGSEISDAETTCRTNSDKPVSVQNHLTEKQRTFADTQKIGKEQNKEIPYRNFIQNLSAKNHSMGKSSLTPKDKEDLTEEGLSEELLLKLTEQDDAFDSQKIQEFPTQTLTKLHSPRSHRSLKPSVSHFDDFVDDLDPDILASISEYDSFSESPICQKKGKKDQTETLTVKSCHEQLKYASSSTRLHSGAPQKLCSVTPSTCVQNSPQKQSTKHEAHKISGVPNHKCQLLLPAAGNAILPQNCHHSRPTKGKHFLNRPSARNKQENARPLASVAEDNSVTNQLFQTGKKFVFKPVNSLGSAISVLHTAPGVPLVSNKLLLPKEDVIAITVSSAEAAGSQTEQNNELMTDDALYESQIIALLDEVESQTIQQPASQAVGSGRDASPPRYSQEEIEKKRLAAMQRKLRSRGKMK